MHSQKEEIGQNALKNYSKKLGFNVVFLFRKRTKKRKKKAT